MIFHIPMQNGIVERMNQTIQERGMTMLKQFGLKLEFWAKALQMGMYLINLSPLRAIRLQVPQALQSGKQPNYDRLHIFRCEAYAHIPRENQTNLPPLSRKCIFLGYGTDGNFGFRLWDPEHKKMIQTSDVVFNEDSILSSRSQPKIGKKVTFDLFGKELEVDMSIVEFDK